MHLKHFADCKIFCYVTYCSFLKHNSVVLLKTLSGREGVKASKCTPRCLHRFQWRYELRQCMLWGLVPELR